ncbi:MAG: class I SAM-dependent methyltransferase, partial [Candidatus Yanofskybacteria bacterium]|nr:class I SAM-dependent methyltransferase [Candidatus Yanofskybacteria bacterium]
MDLKSTYNRIAKDWFEDHKEDTWWISSTNKFVSFLKPGNLVLDVGCGAGIKSKYLIRKGLNVVGIDLSEEMIEIAKIEVPEARFKVADIIEPLEFDEKFDGIFAQAVLLHVPKDDIKNVLTNLIDLLKPKGYLYIAVKGLKEGQPEEQIIKENDYGYEYERFFSFYTPEELIDYLKELGMTIVYNEIISTGNTDWIQII